MELDIPEGVNNSPDAEPVEVAPLPYPENYSRQDAVNLRRSAYYVESDPLFFKYQRDEVTRDTWLAKVSEIRDRYPFPDIPPEETPPTE